jgi:hypothetical protein
VVGRHAIFDTLDVRHAKEHSIHLDGPITYNVSDQDDLDLIYANPVRGPVHIHLPSQSLKDHNRTLIIKDTSLLHAPGSIHNIFITAPSDTKLEYYGTHSDDVTRSFHGLLAGLGATFTLNTSGGAVTLRYIHQPMSAWLVDSQLLGNTRLHPNMTSFPPVPDKVRNGLYNKLI